MSRLGHQDPKWAVGVSWGLTNVELIVLERQMRLRLGDVFERFRRALT